MRLLLPSVIGGLALIVFAPVSIAHFRLIEPACVSRSAKQSFRVG
jgi:hypothetical protein